MKLNRAFKPIVCVLLSVVLMFGFTVSALADGPVSSSGSPGKAHPVASSGHLFLRSTDNGVSEYMSFIEEGDTQTVVFEPESGADLSGYSFEWRKLNDGPVLSTDSSCEITELTDCTVTDTEGNTAKYRFGVSSNTHIVADWSDLESEHDYAGEYNNELWVYEAPQGTEDIALTFDEKSVIAYNDEYHDYDTLRIYDANNSLVGEYTKEQLASATVTVPGNTVKIYLRALGWYITNWGFKVTDSNLPHTGAQFSAEAESPFLSGSAGDSVTMRVNASVSEGDLHYSWFRLNGDDYVALDGQNSSQCTVSVNGKDQYRCTVTDDHGHKKNLSFKVEVDNQLTVKAVGSDSISISAGESVTLEVSASTGSGSLSYKWYNGTRAREDRLIGEAVSAAYTTGRIDYDQGYTCVVSDDYGNSESVTFYVLVLDVEGELILDKETEVSLTEGSSLYYSFTPSESGEYMFRSDSSTKTQISGFDWSLSNIFPSYSNQPSTMSWFASTYYLEGGRKYYFTISRMNDYSGTGSSEGVFNILVSKEVRSGLSATHGLNYEEYKIIPGGSFRMVVDARIEKGSIHYVWIDQQTGQVIPGADGPEYIAKNVTSARQYYTCRVSDDYGHAYDLGFGPTINSGLTVNSASGDYSRVENGIRRVYTLTVEQGQSATLAVDASVSYGDIRFYWNSWTCDIPEGTDRTGKTFTTPVIDRSVQFSCEIEDDYDNYIQLLFDVCVDNGFKAEPVDGRTLIFAESGETVTLNMDMAAAEGNLSVDWWSDYYGGELNISSDRKSCSFVKPNYENVIVNCHVEDEYGNTGNARFYIVDPDNLKEIKAGESGSVYSKEQYEACLKFEPDTSGDYLFEIRYFSDTMLFSGDGKLMGEIDVLNMDDLLPAQLKKGETYYYLVRPFKSYDGTYDYSITGTPSQFLWTDPVWTWAEDYSSATATFTNEEDGTTRSVTVKPVLSINTYIASVIGPDGREYTDSRTVETDFGTGFEDENGDPVDVNVNDDGTAPSGEADNKIVPSVASSIIAEIVFGVQTGDNGIVSHFSVNIDGSLLTGVSEDQLSVVWQKHLNISAGVQFPITVNFDIPNAAPDQRVYVYHFVEGKWVICGMGYGGVVSAVFDSFSPVAVVAETGDVEATDHFHEPVKVEIVEATCQKEGTKEHWKCEGCGKLYSDEAGTVEITEHDLTISKIDHVPGDAVKENEKSATCTEDGVYDSVVYCKNCNTEISREKITINKLAHTLTKTEAKESTAEAEGNIEFWTCSVCGKLFKDADGKNEITAADTVIKKIEKSAEEVVTVSTAVDKNGKDIVVEYESAVEPAEATVAEEVKITTKIASQVIDKIVSANSTETKKDDIQIPETVAVEDLSETKPDELVVVWQGEVKVPEDTVFPVTISFDVGEVKPDQEVFIYHYDGSEWVLVGTGKGSKVDATFDSLSPVAIVVKSATPQTGDQSASVWVFMMLASLAVVTCIAAFGKKKKNA